MKKSEAATFDCRVVITRLDASEILLLRDGAGWALPKIQLHRNRRIAEQLTTGVAAACGLATYCLIPPIASSQGTKPGVACTVLEAVEANCKPPARAHWMPASTADFVCDSEDAARMRHLLAELDCYSSGERNGPFARPGWLRELLRWAQDQVIAVGIRLTGGFQQMNAGPTFALLRLETNHQALWFKATGEPNSHEPSATLVLARLFPHQVPRVLAVHNAWNGWLSAEEPGASLEHSPDFTAWQRAAEQIAQLQIASIPSINDLIAAKAKDLRISKLAEKIDPFLTRMAELMAVQEMETPAPLAKSELAILAQGLKECCALHDSLTIPDTLGHIDFNPGNILVCLDRCVFLDWAEAAVTNPFVTFEYLREHFSRSDILEPSAGGGLLQAYLQPWTALCPEWKLRRALTISPLLAVFAFAVSTNAWLTDNSFHDPSQDAYFRSLTRRMYREAILVAEGSEVCTG